MGVPLGTCSCLCKLHLLLVASRQKDNGFMCLGNVWALFLFLFLAAILPSRLVGWARFEAEQVVGMPLTMKTDNACYVISASRIRSQTTDPTYMDRTQQSFSGFNALRLH
jgi:hypothetical protein